MQATALWEVFGKHPGQQEDFVANIAENIKPALPAVREETISECPMSLWKKLS